MAYSKRWELVHLLGGKCRDCGEENFSVLEIDHIYNDGDIDRKYYTRLDDRYLRNPLRAKQRLQVLCKRCHENKHHPVFETWEPFTISGKMSMIYDKLKMLEGTAHEPVSEQKLINMMIQQYSPSETVQLLRRMLREASIYESKTEHYNTI